MCAAAGGEGREGRRGQPVVPSPTAFLHAVYLQVRDGDRRIVHLKEGSPAGRQVVMSTDPPPLPPYYPY